MITNVSGSPLNTRILFSLCFLSLSLSQREEAAKQNGAYNSISPSPPIASCCADRSDRSGCHVLPFVPNGRERERKAGLIFLPSVLSSSFMFSLQCHHGDRKGEIWELPKESPGFFLCVLLPLGVCTLDKMWLLWSCSIPRLAPWLSVTPQACYFNWVPGCKLRRNNRAAQT